MTGTLLFVAKLAVLLVGAVDGVGADDFTGSAFDAADCPT